MEKNRIDIEVSANTKQAESGLNNVRAGLENILKFENILKNSTVSKFAAMSKSVSDFQNVFKDLQGFENAQNKLKAPMFSDLIKDSELKNMGKSIDDLVNNGLYNYNKRLIEADLKTQKLADSQKGLVGFWKKTNDQTFEFNGNMLSLLFFGMEIKRVFGAAFSSIIESYKNIIPEQSEFNRQTTRLNANWEYFKFQLGDVLANSKIFDIFINGSILLIKKFQGLSDETKQFIVVGLGIGVLVGAVLMFVGVVLLGIAAIGNILIGLGFIEAASLKAFGPAMIARVKTFWATVTSPMAGAVAIIAAGFILSSKIINQWLVDEGKEIDGFWKNLLAIVSTFADGLVNIFILAVAGVINLFLGLGSGIYNTIKIIGEDIVSLGKGIKRAIVAVFTGEDVSDAFFSAFDGLNDRVGDILNTSNWFTNAMTTVNDLSTAWTTEINKLNKDTIDALSTPVADTSAEMAQLLKDVEDFNNTYGNVGTTDGGDTTTNETYNIYMDGTSYGITGVGSDLKKAVNKELEDLGIFPTVAGAKI